MDASAQVVRQIERERELSPLPVCSGQDISGLGAGHPQCGGVVICFTQTTHPSARLLPDTLTNTPAMMRKQISGQLMSRES